MFLQETEKLNIHPERWKTLKSLAEPPKQDWRMRPTESTLRRMAERPKLATRWKAEGDKATGELIEQPNRCLARDSNLMPGSKERSDKPTMSMDPRPVQRQRLDQNRVPWWRGRVKHGEARGAVVGGRRRELMVTSFSSVARLQKEIW